jgi:hypothetical protein
MRAENSAPVSDDISAKAISCRDAPSKLAQWNAEFISMNVSATVAPPFSHAKPSLGIDQFFVRSVPGKVITRGNGIINPRLQPGDNLREALETCFFGPVTCITRACAVAAIGVTICHLAALPAG